ncbi:type II secretion system minor pseudopilin GspI [Brevundimonas sp. 2R-24]|uniref:Type II secretion system protein I n=1 Tax=Peiella sedimenti TaxID=3061083 RepID=A0ABT8SJ40_9CAUL|nr:type II secretion system minor pseudopilin GspI [Caulobacteraceae bacterium XZ-24]
MPADRQGFSLIELLVALAVFSLAVVALLNLTGESARTAAELETRALASVVAENRAVEAVTGLAPLVLGQEEGVEQAAGRAWRWTRITSGTPEPGLYRVDIRVQAQGRPGSAAEVKVFRSASA